MRPWWALCAGPSAAALLVYDGLTCAWGICACRRATRVGASASGHVGARSPSRGQSRSRSRTVRRTSTSTNRGVCCSTTTTCAWQTHPQHPPTAPRGIALTRAHLGHTHSPLAVQVHTFDYVTMAIVKVVKTITRKKAHRITVQCHSMGTATVTTTWKQMAKQMCLKLQKFGLTSSIAPDGS